MTDPQTQRERRRDLVRFIRESDACQIVNQLSDGFDGFCILGLICEHFRIQTGRGYWDDAFVSGAFTTEFAFVAWDDPFDGYTLSTENLPEPVRNYYGFASKELHFWTEDLGDENFVSLNDESSYTLTQLAAIIEAEPQGLIVSHETVGA